MHVTVAEPGRRQRVKENTVNGDANKESTPKESIVKGSTVKEKRVTARARIMSGSICAIAGAAVLAGALTMASGGAASAAPSAHRAPRADGGLLAAVSRSVAVSRSTAVSRSAALSRLLPAARPVAGFTTSVPPGLQPPVGNVLTAQFIASGVQVYQCTAGAWVFLEPAANLVGSATGSSAIQTAIHYKGPTWESTTDGSLVQGRTIASSPVPGSIPQLLLQATANRGTGIFGTVTYINRLDTSGGAAPAGSCTSGQTVGVPYSAQYLFYVPGS